MSDPNDTGPDSPDYDKPLSAEAQAAMAKARRSFRFSISILLLGFMAIALALVYRVMRDAPPPTIAETVLVPVGAEVISAVLSDGAINVTYQVNGVTTLGLFDSKTGAMTRSVVIGAE